MQRWCVCKHRVLHGVLWILKTGAAWADLPRGLPTVPDLSRSRAKSRHGGPSWRELVRWW